MVEAWHLGLACHNTIIMWLIICKINHENCSLNQIHKYFGKQSKDIQNLFLTNLDKFRETWLSNLSLVDDHIDKVEFMSPSFGTNLVVC